AVVEGNETVVVTLAANAAYSIGSPSTGTVTIIDNDVPAGPTLTASPATVVPGGTVTGVWSGLTNPTGRDWIGLYGVGAANGSYQSWVYVNCTKFPGAPIGSGSCQFTAPGTNGTYEFRLLANDGFATVLTSNQFTVSNLPVVTVTASVSNAAEGGAAGKFVVSRTGNTASPLTVFYTLGGTAT